MASDFPPGVFNVEATFAPAPNVNQQQVKKAVLNALEPLAASNTEPEVKVEYTPTR